MKTQLRFPAAWALARVAPAVLIAALLLSACSGGQVPVGRGTLPAGGATPPGVSTLAQPTTDTTAPVAATPTLPPLGSTAPAAAPTDTPFVGMPTVYPGPGEATAPALAAQDVEPTPQPTGAPAKAFQDCALTPGLVGCAQSAAPIPARLAVYDASTGRLLGLDLTTGEGWQIRMDSEPNRLDWSAQAQNLLVRTGEGNFTVLGADGSFQKSFEQSPEYPAPAWQPDGSLQRNGTIHSPEGSNAWLVAPSTGADGAAPAGWQIQFRPKAADHKNMPLESGGPDQAYALRGWLAGMPRRVLVQDFTGGHPGPLLIADLDGATLTPVQASVPAGSRAVAANPTAGPLAVLTTGAEAGPDGPPVPPGAGLRLALVDPATGQASFPLPEGVTVTEMAWKPDGSRLAIAVPPLGAQASDAARETFTTAGIYLLNPDTKRVQPLTWSGTAADGWPNWSPDGGTLVYARALPDAAGGYRMQVRARGAGGEDRLLVADLPAPETVAGAVMFDRWLAFGRQE